MFFGQSVLSLDDERKLLLPPAFRELFGQVIYVTCGFEQNLLLMTEQTFRERSRQLGSLNMADPTVRLLQRLLLANAQRIQVEEDGQAVLPAVLLDFAGARKEIILVGQGEYIEAWSPAGWEKESALLRDAEANSSRFAQLNLSFGQA
jgi:MraZ protein